LRTPPRLLAAGLLFPLALGAAPIEGDPSAGAAALGGAAQEHAPLDEALAAGVTRRALVVGTNDGGGELEPLRYAERDALRFADLLGALGGFEDGELSVLMSPTPEALDAEMARLSAEMEGGGDGLFLFYYSGHADAAGLLLGDTRYPYDDLKSRIRDVPADLHLGILDACRSGAITRIKGASVSDPFLLEEGLDAEGEAWLTASAADEDAQESDSLGGSFFTYYLLSGLRGAADTGGDGWVSLGEAYNYAYDRTVARTGGTEGGTQHPTYNFQLQGNGDLRLTSVNEATARVTFPEDGAGDITVLRQPDNLPVAEVSKVHGKVVSLALEPGRYLLRRRAGGELQEVTLSLSTGSDHVVERWGSATQELAARKGHAPLPEDTLPEDTAALEGQAVGPAEAVIRDVLTEIDDYDLEELAERYGDAREKMQGIDWRHSPVLAGGASALLPGAGQFYNQDWVRGALFLGGVLALNSGGYGISAMSDQTTGFTGSLLGPNVVTMMGAMVYGWSVADAAWRAKGISDFRPKEGVTFSIESAWLDPGEAQKIDIRNATPHAAGVGADWILAPGFSLGLDRAGYVRDATTGDWSASVGGRMMVAAEWQRLRPGLFVAAGGRFYSTQANGAYARQTVAGGANLRWYATPRYFVGYEFRYELEAGDPRMSHGGGLGVHFGGARD